MTTSLPLYRSRTSSTKDLNEERSLASPVKEVKLEEKKGKVVRLSYLDIM